MRNLLAVLAGILLLAPAATQAGPYVLLDAGAFGAAGAAGCGLGIGGTQVIADRHPFEIEIFFADTGDNPDSLSVLPPPEGGYTSLGEKNDGEEYGFLVKAGYRVAEKVFLMAGAGASFQDTVSLAQNNSTGGVYVRSTGTNSYFNAYGGVMYQAEKILLSLGYENRRGVVLGIGTTW